MGPVQELTTKALQRVIKNAQNITGCSLSLLQDIANTRYLSRATIVKDSSHPGHLYFPSYLLEGDTGQLKQARTYLQIVLSKSHSVPELRDALHYLQYLRQSLWTVHISVLELHFIVLPALFTFFTWIWLRSGLCVCGYHIVAPCVYCSTSLKFHCISMQWQ